MLLKSRESGASNRTERRSNFVYSTSNCRSITYLRPVCSVFYVDNQRIILLRVKQLYPPLRITRHHAEMEGSSNIYPHIVRVSPIREMANSDSKTFRENKKLPVVISTRPPSDPCGPFGYRLSRISKHNGGFHVEKTCYFPKERFSSYE